MDRRGRGGRGSRARRAAILSLVLPAEVIVDVGCGHGLVASAMGAIGTERHARTLPSRRGFPKVVADGLTAFRRVDLAIVTGMGPRKILRILESGPRPRAAILHSPERSAWLRQGLADAGWRIDAERLAPEGRKLAEILRVVPGSETARGYLLWFGPKLLRDPLVVPHALRLRSHWDHVRCHAPEGSRSRLRATGWLGFLDRLLGGASLPSPAIRALLEGPRPSEVTS